MELSAQAAAKTTRDIVALLKSAGEQRRELISALYGKNGEPDEALRGGEEQQRDRHATALKSLLVQRDRLTEDVDELSAALEEKLEAVALLEKRCKERYGAALSARRHATRRRKAFTGCCFVLGVFCGRSDERCMALVEEGLQRKGRRELLEQQLQLQLQRVRRWFFCCLARLPWVS